MAGHPCALVEELHHLGTQAHVELLPDQHGGHGVVVAFDVHVGVNIDPGMFPLRICIGGAGERAEGGPVECLKQLLAGTGELFAGTGIQGQPEGSEGGIDLREGEKGVVPESGQQPALHDVDADLHLALSRGLAARAGMMAKP
jgi:hypothetical protein